MYWVCQFALEKSEILRIIQNWPQVSGQVLLFFIHLLFLLLVCVSLGIDLMVLLLLNLGSRPGQSERETRYRGANQHNSTLGLRKETYVHNRVNCSNDCQLILWKHRTSAQILTNRSNPPALHLLVNALNNMSLCAVNRWSYGCGGDSCYGYVWNLWSVC